MILWRKRPERKDEVHEFPVWNVHEAHGRSAAVGRNAPSRTQTIILQVVYWMGWHACYECVCCERLWTAVFTKCFLSMHLLHLTLSPLRPTPPPPPPHFSLALFIVLSAHALLPPSYFQNLYSPDSFLSQIEDTEVVASLWGLFPTGRSKQKMNFDKMSRSMRFHYSNEVLQKVDGPKLYK